MRRSTLLTRALGTGALATAATSLALVYVPVTTSVPRLDIVGALAATAVLTAAWALACLTAPRLTTPDTPPPAEPPALPSQLPAIPRDFGRATGAVLIALTPCTLAWLAMRGGTFIGSFLFFLTLFGTLKIATFLRRSASPKAFRDKVRVLIEDAAAGEVHAVRVRVGRPLLLRYSERGDRPGQISVTQEYSLLLHDASGDEIPLATTEVSELARAGELLSGTQGWLMWSRRYKLIESMQPVAFVADRDGTTILGLTNPAEVTYRTATHSVRDPRPTTRDRRARPLRRNAKFRLPVHGPIAAGALLASLPALLLGTDGLPGLLAWLLCGLAVAAFVTGVLRGVSATADCVVKDTEWTERDEQDPSIT
ncbi:hypothetical protein EOT10_09780 [Streptomyces antnestii]|uniref:Uncharacterized protein n=1 Tax=Streptomyces antnestii TaxID=2494256 RepID=A0A3S2XX56_9ACTN|nr:hypothetical protein [Streptomyces sp. San01]RVU27443.1 hypothetical protein EOT10_09780 [Streptomyces sp. San01]